MYTVKRLAEMPLLCGVDTRAIIKSIPQIVKTDFENVCEIIRLIQKYPIPPYAVSACKSIFLRDPDMISDSLERLHNLKLPNNVFEHPYILKLACSMHTIRNELNVLDGDGSLVSHENFAE